MQVVVTGMGVVSPVGCDLESFWGSVCRGESGIRPITVFDAAEFAFQRAGEVRDFVPPVESAAAPDRGTAFMLGSVHEAMTTAGFCAGADSHPRAGVVLGTNFGGICSGERTLAETLGHGESSGSDFGEYVFQSAADHVADAWGLAGPRSVLSLSCASGAAAIAVGADAIRAGRADVMVAGGYDALSDFVWSGLSVLRTITKDEVRPFDVNRRGTIFSEGAGALVLESAQHAARRGAVPLAVVAGCATNNNAHHMTAPAKEGAGSAAVMAAALADAGLDPSRVDHVNAHGTGTKYNDITETQAIKAVFGDHAARLPVTAIKSSIGHMMGAAGAVESIAAVLSMRDGIVPPTINSVEPDPDCDLDVVFTQQRACTVDCALSNSAGIGGCNAAVVFTRPGGEV